jgi:hypothetical protein
VAEGGGLLNRCRGSTPTVSSNLIPSANGALLYAVAAVAATFQVAVAGSQWRRKPSARMTFRTVANSGFPSLLSAL